MSEVRGQCPSLKNEAHGRLLRDGRTMLLGRRKSDSLPKNVLGAARM